MQGRRIFRERTPQRSRRGHDTTNGRMSMSSQRTNGEYIEIKDDIFLHLRDWGVGPAIVFIPGWPFGHEMFEYQFTQLPQQGYRCIGISMRGFGRSSKPWGDYTYDVFADDLFWQSFRNSFYFAVLTTAGVAVVALAAALALKHVTRGQTFFRVVLYLPVILSISVIGIVWGRVISNDGLINYYITRLGIPRISFLGDASLVIPSLSVVTVWWSFGFPMLIFLAALYAIPESLYEAARLDGAGNCNLTRKAAAQALVDWLANPVYFPDVDNALIIGDLNSYDYEDPIDMIKLGADDSAGTEDDYLDLMRVLRGDEAYGYLFGSQIGYLDYALANTNLAERVVDVNFWHINADESDLINYDMTYKKDAQDAIYAPDAYRSSDHDPVILTLLFNTAPAANNMIISTNEDTPYEFGLDVSDAEGDGLVVTILSGPLHGSLNIVGTTVTYTPAENYHGPDEFTYTVNDGEFDSEVATVTITVIPVNDAPVASGATYDLVENGNIVFNLDASDVDDDELTIIVTVEPLHGSLECVGEVCTYTPMPGWYGEDSLSFKANDGTLDSNEAVVTFRVAALPRIYLPIAFK